MEWTTIFLLAVIILCALLGSGLWIALTLGGTGIVLLLAAGYPLNAVSTIFWTQTGNFVLVAIPLFILMGEIILSSGISSRFYQSISPWARFLPGRLYSINILATGLFSAVSGSSVATAAAIGSVAIPELQKRGYAKRLNYGTIAAGGTLGILIPPSAGLIIYGSLVNANIATLFIAAVIPGLLVIATFLVYVALACTIVPSMLPPDEERASLRQLLATLPGLLPITMLIAMVIGSIYSGYATPTEAAALGVAGAALIAVLNGEMRGGLFLHCLKRAVTSTAMIMFIVLGAQIVAYAFARTGASRELVDWVIALNMGPWEVFLVLCVMYLILGCFIDAISIMVLTLPLVHPLIVALGFDPIWFGIVLIILIEVGMITPPVGLNLFVIQNFAGRKGSFGEIAIGSAPFVVLMLLVVAMLCVWPQLVLWLPAGM